jgi:hypothetical protein
MTNATEIMIPTIGARISVAEPKRKKQGITGSSTSRT